MSKFKDHHVIYIAHFRKTSKAHLKDSVGFSVVRAHISPTCGTKSMFPHCPARRNSNTQSRPWVAAQAANKRIADGGLRMERLASEQVVAQVEEILLADPRQKGCLLGRLRRPWLDPVQPVSPERGFLIQPRV